MDKLKEYFQKVLEKINNFKNLEFYNKYKVFILSAIVGILTLIFLLTFVVFSGEKEKNYTPLFTDLSPQAVEEVVKELSKEHVPFKVSKDSKTIEVPKDQVYRLRITLLSKGIPSTGEIDFSIFKEPQYGMSKYQMDILYKKALKNEIEKTISALTPVESAKVNIVFPEDSVFWEEGQEAKASVVLKLYPGATLTKDQVRGIINLLEKSVKDLKKENISIVDQYGRDLTEYIEETPTDLTEKKLKIKRKIERELEEKVRRMLSKIYGPDRVSVKVSADVDFSKEEVKEHYYDQDKSAVVSEKRSKENESVAIQGGIPGTASNVPPAPGRNFFIGSQLGNGYPKNKKKSETITNYNNGEVVKKIILDSPKIKRLSVAVAVSGKYINQNGTIKYIPLTEEEIFSIKKLVRSAIGYSKERGDNITVVSLPFNIAKSKFVVQKTTSIIPLPNIPLNTIIALLIPAILLLLLLIASILYIKRKMQAKKQKEQLALLQKKKALEEKAKEIQNVLKEAEAENITVSDLENLIPGFDISRLRNKYELVEKVSKHVSELVKKDPKRAAEVIRKWLNS